MAEFPENVLIIQALTIKEIMETQMETLVETKKESFQAGQDDSFHMEILRDLSG